MSLHQQQVLSNEIEWDSPSVEWMMVVSVDAAEPDGFAIDADQAAFELNDPESDFLMHSLSVRVRSERDLDVVEVGGLGRPFQWVDDRNAKIDLPICTDGALGAGDCDASPFSLLSNGNLDSCFQGGLDIDCGLEYTMLILAV